MSKPETSFVWVHMQVKDPVTDRTHEIHINVEDELYIDESRLNEEFARQASSVAWWQVLLGWKSLEVSGAKAYADRIRAQAYLDIRHKMETMPEGEGKGKTYKPTEAQISAKVAVDPDVCSTEDRVRKLEAEYKILNGVCKGVNDRTYTLSSLGSHIRAMAPSTGGEMSISSLDETVTRIKDRARKSRTGIDAIDNFEG